jgi:hypothetical protein
MVAVTPGDESLGSFLVNFPQQSYSSRMMEIMSSVSREAGTEELEGAVDIAVMRELILMLAEIWEMNAPSEGGQKLIISDQYSSSEMVTPAARQSSWAECRRSNSACRFVPDQVRMSRSSERRWA